MNLEKFDQVFDEFWDKVEPVYNEYDFVGYDDQDDKEMIRHFCREFSKYIKNISLEKIKKMGQEKPEGTSVLCITVKGKDRIFINGSEIEIFLVGKSAIKGQVRLGFISKKDKYEIKRKHEIGEARKRRNIIRSVYQNGGQLPGHSHAEGKPA